MSMQFDSSYLQARQTRVLKCQAVMCHRSYILYSRTKLSSVCNVHTEGFNVILVIIRTHRSTQCYTCDHPNKCRACTATFSAIIKPYDKGLTSQGETNPQEQVNMVTTPKILHVRVQTFNNLNPTVSTSRKRRHWIGDRNKGIP